MYIPFNKPYMTGKGALVHLAGPCERPICPATGNSPEKCSGLA